MKKITIILIALSMLFMCMTSCSGSKDPGQTPDDSNPSASQTVYELLDDLAHKDYSDIKIDIVTTAEFAKLCSNYVLTENKVTYSIEKLNLLPSDGNISASPSSYKTTVEGCAQIKNGQVVELDGNKDISLPSYSELKGNFNFEESNFKNAVVGTNSFEADVISPSQFYGADVDMSNLKVKIKYTETSLTEIIISYSTANSTVETVYVFET